MDIDFKFTGWERVSVPEEYSQMVLEKISSGEINTANDLFNIPELRNKLETEVLSDTFTEMEVNDNGMFSTIEAFNGSDRIFGNGIN